MTTSSWGPGRRIAFRFGFLVAAFLTLPFPLSLLPKMGWLSELWNAPWSWGVRWLAAHAFGIADVSPLRNGNGDRSWNYLLLLLMVIVAALGTAVWSIADRRRASYARLAAASWVVFNR